ncbi:MAG: KR domain-containing protein, partial [Kamptonema sp. SIO4C4]|nr:KR domain-containing protein [Kamptonema sp. SIO4C4]
GAGQVDYCAANAFLDSFAVSSEAQHAPRIISINWDMWQQVGMGANIANLPEALKQQRLETLKTGITPNEGVEALNRILSSGLNRIIVSTQDWQEVLNRQNEIATEQLSEVPAGSASHSIPSKANKFDVPDNYIQQTIAGLWQEQLGVELVGIHDNFFELGGHSLLAVKVIGQLREIFDVELSLHHLLEAPTVAQVADVISQQLLQREDGVDNVLTEIENLSAAELQQQLTQES